MSLKETIAAKKTQKREQLRKATAELFAERGVDETAIDDIVRRAGVAKGTFYLYFKNKADILGDLVAARSRVILKQALQRTPAHHGASLADDVLAFVEEIAEIMRRNRRALELIHKNLTWGLYRRLVAEAETDETLREIKERFWGRVPATKDPVRDPEKILFVLIELTSSICYSAIVHSEPAGLEEMKPVLLDSVRRILA